MSSMYLWFGGFTGSAFFYGVWLGLCLTPPFAWTPVSQGGPAAGQAVPSQEQGSRVG